MATMGHRGRGDQNALVMHPAVFDILRGGIGLGFGNVHCTTTDHDTTCGEHGQLCEDHTNGHITNSLSGLPVGVSGGLAPVPIRYMPYKGQRVLNGAMELTLLLRSGIKNYAILGWLRASCPVLIPKAARTVMLFGGFGAVRVKQAGLRTRGLWAWRG